MTTPIIEEPLYGQLQIETTTTTTTFSWIDHTQYISSFDYQEGSQEPQPGQVGPDIGSLTASFTNMATVPKSGDYIRVRKYGASTYIFTGYITDVMQRKIFERRDSLTAPTTITTISARDWVGLLSQFVSEGIDGRNLSGPQDDSTAGYGMDSRVRALNYTIDSTLATELINIKTVTNPVKLNHTDFSGSLADHMDLACRSSYCYWYGTHNLPTNATTGRTDLIDYELWSVSNSSGYKFTDVAGAAADLHYTEIDLETRSSDLANVVTIKNRTFIAPYAEDLTIVGGSNESGLVTVGNNRQVRGIVPETSWVTKDDTSIAAYGPRNIDIETNVNTGYMDFHWKNLIFNPSAEYDAMGYAKTATLGWNIVSRRDPLVEDGITRKFGNWAIRGYGGGQTTGKISYSGGESDGIPIDGGKYYRFSFWGARHTTPSTARMRAVIRWYGANGTEINNTLGSWVSLTAVDTWYKATVVALLSGSAQRATVEMEFNTNSTTSWGAGASVYVDGLMFHEEESGGPYDFDYIDGDFAPDSSRIALWSGTVGDSPTWVVENKLDTIAALWATQYASTAIRPTRIRWNAQENLTAVSALTVGKTIQLQQGGVTTTQRIVGISGSVDPERYMIDYYLVKV